MIEINESANWVDDLTKAGFEKVGKDLFRKTVHVGKGLFGDYYCSIIFYLHEDNDAVELRFKVGGGSKDDYNQLNGASNINQLLRSLLRDPLFSFYDPGVLFLLSDGYYQDTGADFALLKFKNLNKFDHLSLSPVFNHLQLFVNNLLKEVPMADPNFKTTPQAKFLFRGKSIKVPRGKAVAYSKKLRR